MFDHVLRSAGFRVTEAADGLTGYQRAAANPPDIIIADVMMPGPLDGIELTRKLRMNEATRSVPVLVLTANTLDDVRQQAERAGAVAFLTKPCAPETLVGALDALLPPHPARTARTGRSPGTGKRKRGRKTTPKPGC